MQPGDPLDPKTRLGPLISQEQHGARARLHREGPREGAEVLVGGGRALYGGEERGLLGAADGVRRVQEEHCIAREEIFGPVLAVLTFSDEDEALALANRTSTVSPPASGRATSEGAPLRPRAQAGTVWINTYHPGDAASPFGGYKQSGFGRELGEYSLDLYTQIKSVWVDLN
jgi:acyl-CoA reductase-like NAD-dependent aldehyde dehydrogenase